MFDKRVGQMIDISDAYIGELDDSFVIQRKFAAMMVDNYDNLIMDVIVETAKEEGITDLCILNKQFVIEAIKEKLEREGYGETDRNL